MDAPTLAVEHLGKSFGPVRAVGPGRACGTVRALDQTGPARIGGSEGIQRAERVEGVESARGGGGRSGAGRREGGKRGVRGDGVRLRVVRAGAVVRPAAVGSAAVRGARRRGVRVGVCRGGMGGVDGLDGIGVRVRVRLGVGVGAALVAVLPALRSPGASSAPVASLSLTLLAVFAGGLLWAWAATAAALRRPLLASLRDE